MSEYPPIQDDITLVLRAQKIIVHENVRLNVGISAQVDQSTSEADFRTEIQDTLKKFVLTDWKIQAIQRFKGSNRYETVSVSATARVPECENYQLQERATALSRIGFELVHPSVDYSLTFDEIQKVNQELRLMLLKNALTEVADINKAFKDGAPGFRQIFRISSSRFDVGSNDMMSTANSMAPLHISQLNQKYSGSEQVSAAYNITAQGGTGGGDDEFYGDEGTGEPLDLNVSTRFSMTGSFVLRHVVN